MATKEGIIPPSSTWPAEINSGSGDDPFRVGLVLREWVEGPPNLTIAPVLADNLEWRRLVLDCQLEGEHLGEWWNEKPVVYERELTDEYLSRRLQRHRLLHTPSTVHHLRALAALLSQTKGLIDLNTSADMVREASNQLPFSSQPAPGMLVVTKAHVWCFELDELPHLAGGFRPPHEFTVAGLHGYGLAPVEVWDKARKAANRHADWLVNVQWHGTPSLRVLDGFPLGDQRVRSLAHPTATPRTKTDDYLTEALLGLPGLLQVLARMCPDDRHWSIEKHLNDVQRRVGKRRGKRGLPRTPNDPSWRQRFRDQVMAELGPVDANRTRPEDT